MKKKKLQESPRIIPAGTKQETGFSRFIKKEKKAGDIRIIKDAKANNEEEISGEDVSKQEPGDSTDIQKSPPLTDSEDRPQRAQNQD